MALLRLSLSPDVETSVPLSILDRSRTRVGESEAEALRQTVRFAQQAEELGYHRFWVSEHHSVPGVVGSAPTVLAAAVAGATSRIRVGTGGVMLPNHQPLVIAEQFGMLEALHPGRIDLGIGRAPGTDQITAYALRRTMDPSADDLPKQLAELRAFFAGTFPHITAVPGHGQEPAIWLLGSSDFSARLAGALGLPFSFAHHFMPQNTVAALEIYRRSFRPSATLAEPYAMLGVAVVCAESDERARWLHAPSVLSFLRVRSGRPTVLPSPEEAAAYEFSPGEKSFVEGWTASHIVGSPDTVRDGLRELQRRTAADELMLTTMLHGHADRLVSYELVAQALAGPVSRVA